MTDFALEYEAIKEQVRQAVEEPLECARCGDDISVGLGVVIPLPARGAQTETICRCCAGMSAVPAKRVPIGDPLPEF